MVKQALPSGPTDAPSEPGGRRCICDTDAIVQIDDPYRLKGESMERITVEKNGLPTATAKVEKNGLHTAEAKDGTQSIPAKIVRIVTAPHFMAMTLSTLLYISMGETAFASRLHYAESLFTLGILPMVPYLICAVIPSLRRKGRKLERTLGIVFSVLGYIMGTLFSLFGGGTAVETTLYLTYLISGAAIALLSFAMHFKASGHTCGVSGPAAMLVYYLGAAFIPMFALLIPVFMSSLKLRRHSVSQLIVGSVVPVVSMLIAILIVSGI